MSAPSFDVWLSDRLSYFMGYDAPELVPYIKSLSPDDATENLRSLIPTSEDSTKFISKVVSELRANMLAAPARHTPPVAPALSELLRQRGGSDADATLLVAKKDVSRSKHKISVGFPEVPTAKSATPVETRDAPSAPPSVCNCYATVHPMQCNCVSCGKIICQMERGENCGFCGAMLPAASPAIPPSNAIAAIEHKDKLLIFDRTSASRTTVLDDQVDYFQDASSTWLSAGEREAAQEKAKQRQQALLHRRKAMRIQLDFSGRTVVVTDIDDAEAQASKAQLLATAGRCRGNLGAATTTAIPVLPAPPVPGAIEVVGGYFANPTLCGRAAEIYASLLQDVTR